MPLDPGCAPLLGARRTPLPTDLIFLIVTAIVGGLLVLGASLAAVRERGGRSAMDSISFANGWGKYEPDPDVAEVESAGPATASTAVVRVLWWVTIAAVLVGVGLSNSYVGNQPFIFGIGGVAVVAVVVLHELMPRAWRNELTVAAEVGIAIALTTGLLLLTGYGASPYVFALDLIAVAVALGSGGWAAVLATAIATAVYAGVIAVDPSPDRIAGIGVLRIALNVGSLWLLAFLAGVFANHQRRVRRMLSDLSRIDPLTGLFNRGQMYPTLEQEVRRTRRSTRGFSVLMIDLDGLKLVNDSLGHQRGDEVLRALGRAIRGNIRTVDSAYRYGGDEFVVLLPETDYSGAFVVAEKIRSDAEEMGSRMEVEGAATSVSIGLVSHPEDGATAEELVRAADRAMYNAKALGKNQISGYPRPPRLAAPVAIRPPGDDGQPERQMDRPPIPVPVLPSGGRAPSNIDPAAPQAAAQAPATAASATAAPATAGSATSASAHASPAIAAPAESQPGTSPAPEAQAAKGLSEERWTPVAEAAVPKVGIPIAERGEEEPDAADVRRQIAVASRSFDPDHQIRRAMDAFLSPPGKRPPRRPD
jgi:diguanylate cyclase (GGDEF)-like protein